MYFQVADIEVNIVLSIVVDIPFHNLDILVDIAHYKLVHSVEH